MDTKGLFVKLKAKPGKEHDVEDFLKSAVPLVEQEPGTKAWFAVDLGNSEYAIFDVFPDEKSRDAHLKGPIAKALMANADALLAKAPDIQKLDVLAESFKDVLSESYK